MRKIVITGRGVVTPLGNGLAANGAALRAGRSGIVFNPEWAEMGLTSHIYGKADEEQAECPLLDRKTRRFTSPNSVMAVAAAWEAMQEAGLTKADFQKYRVAVIGGCAGSNYEEIYRGAATFLEHHKVRKVTPFIVPRVMVSSAASNLSLLLGITGESYDISSACATSAHSIMIARRLLQSGLYDIVIAGGSEEVNWVHALGFDAMRALSTGRNATPDQASRPFDRDRDGFVIAEGAGILILESEEFARARGAQPKMVVSGAAANSNAVDMVVPDAKSSALVMQAALTDANLRPEQVSYINTHGTSTPIGDTAEAEAIKIVFGAHSPAVNSTKSMTGHMIGAAGVVEAIFSTIMLEQEFICPSLNLDNPQPEFAGIDFVRHTSRTVRFDHAISNSLGFGGTNACLVLSRYN